MRSGWFQFVEFSVLLMLLNAGISGAAEETPSSPATQPASPTTQPGVGDLAKDFKLYTLDNQTVELANLRQSGPVVLVVLRGWVGYQCPICNRQVGDLIAHGQELTATGASVVLVYPGPAHNLESHAEDFITGKTLPEHFYFVIDPMMAFVSDYGLRWNARRENAYPATFVIAADGKIVFEKISRTHGNRATATQILAALATTK